ncbi:MAG: uracil-DNA glycosylase family protein, partial [Pseudomonadota bacterium]
MSREQEIGLASGVVVHGACPPLGALGEEIAACRLCLEAPKSAPMPHPPRPVAVLSQTAKICICGQAPGTRVHASGRPFTDPSGNRLRAWLGMDETTFYNPSKLAIVPMGFCFPGLDAKGGDLPPRSECRATWHARVFALMPQLELIILIGRYAQRWHLGQIDGYRVPRTLTETVANWRTIYDPDAPRRYLAVPHPSWRNNAWFKR